MEDLLNELRKSNRIFGAEFIKKDGSHRKMSARLGVKKGVKGVGLKYDPIQKRLLPVFDCNKRAFRMINLDTLIKIVHQGKTYQIK